MVEFPLPAVVTIDEGIARPRYPSLKGIMAAKKKPLEVKPAQLGEARLTVRSMELPPERPPAGSSARARRRVPELVRLLQTKRRCSDGQHLRVRGIARRRAAEGGARGGDRRAQRRPTPPAAGKCTRCSSAPPGIAALGAGARAARRRRGDRRRARGLRALQPRGRSRPRPPTRIKAGGYRAAFFAASRAGAGPRAARRGEARRRAWRRDVTAFDRRRATRSSCAHPGYTGKIIATLRLTGAPARAHRCARAPSRPSGSRERRGVRSDGAGARSGAAARVVVTEIGRRRHRASSTSATRR